MTREQLPDLLRRKDVCRRYQIDRTTLHRWVCHGKFPRPVRLPGGQPAWRIDTLDKWERSREATRARA